MEGHKRAREHPILAMLKGLVAHSLALPTGAGRPSPSAPLSPVPVPPVPHHFSSYSLTFTFAFYSAAPLSTTCATLGVCNTQLPSGGYQGSMGSLLSLLFPPKPPLAPNNPLLWGQRLQGHLYRLCQASVTRQASPSVRHRTFL